MARWGCASGRRKQLQRLKKYEIREFDPSIFDQAASAPPPTPPPTYRSYVAPVPKKLNIKTIPKPESRAKTRVPARPTGSDVAPIRLQTRPLPVAAQIKRRKTQIKKPYVISSEVVNIALERRGNQIIFKRSIWVITITLFTNIYNMYNADGLAVD